MNEEVKNEIKAVLNSWQRALLASSNWAGVFSDATPRQKKNYLKCIDYMCEEIFRIIEKEERM